MRLALALLALAACGVPIEEYRRKDDESRAYRRAYEAAEDQRELMVAQGDAMSELKLRVASLEALLADERKKTAQLEAEHALVVQTLSRMQQDGGSEVAR